jgi:phosphoribosyl 1,2-cyclic phosphate phosphodiesterase
MKVTILGSGSCYGVPTVGGDWGECDPKNPKNKRTVASIMVESDRAKLLIDMSPDFHAQSCAHDLKNLDAILATHGHADHILGYFHLPRFMQHCKDRVVPLYADEATQEDITRMFWFQMGEQGDVKFSYGGTTRWDTITPYRDFAVGDMQVQSFVQDHGSIKSHGFRIGNFAYSTDFNSFPAESEQYLHGLDCWILECNRKDMPAKDPDKHMYVERALAFIDNFKPKQAYLTHLNVTMDHDMITRQLPPNVHLAYDGLVLDL